MKWNNGIFEKVANGIKRAVEFVINVLLFVPRLVLEGFKKLMGRAEDATAEEFDEDAEELGEEKNEEVVVEDKKDDESSDGAAESKNDSEKEVVVEDKKDDESEHESSDAITESKNDSEKEVNSESKVEETSKEVVVEDKKDDESEHESSDAITESKNDSEKEVVVEDKKDDEVIAATAEPEKEIVKAEVIDTETGTVIETVDTAISKEDKKKSQDKDTTKEKPKHTEEKVTLPEEELKFNNSMSQSINNMRIDMLHGYKGYFSAHVHDFAEAFLGVVAFKAGKPKDATISDQFYYDIIRDMHDSKLVIKIRDGKTQKISIDDELAKMLRNAIDNIPIFLDYDMGNIFERFEQCFVNFIKGVYDIVQAGNGEIHKVDAASAVA